MNYFFKTLTIISSIVSSLTIGIASDNTPNIGGGTPHK